MVKHLPTMRETWVLSLVWEDLLEKEMATHSSILALKIPRTEGPGRLQSMGSQRVGHDWATSLSLSLAKGDQDHPQEKEMQKRQNDCLRRPYKQLWGEVKGKGEKERYTHLNTELQRTTWRDKKAFLSDRCKEIEENNRMGKTRDLFKKIRDTKEIGRASCRERV